MTDNNYHKSRKKLSTLLFETALPNEYLVVLGKKEITPILGGRKFKWGKKFLRVPANVQKLKFETDNANMDYQGIGIEGYATWRINPDKPEVAIKTLDFFNDDNPMLKTNEDLKTICIEAVRHVIANMSIEDALKNKDAIADNLTKQLIEIERKWGIVFDQVGIEKVKIMSNKLFNDLQSEFRNKLRLESSKTQIATDRAIAKEENEIREKNELERIQTEQKIELQDVEKNKQLSKRQLDDEKELKDKERLIKEEEFRKEIEFNLEKEQKKHDLKELEQDLQIKLNEKETKVLTVKLELQKLENILRTKQLEVDQLKRKLDQSYTPEELNSRLIENLPRIFESINIDSYSVMDSGDGKTNFPVTQIMQEIIQVLKNNEILDNKSKKSKK